MKRLETFEHGEHSNDDWHMGHAEAEEVLPDLAFYRTLIANVVFIGNKDTKDWVLIDCGIAHYSKRIIEAAEKGLDRTIPAGDSPHSRSLRPCRICEEARTPLGSTHIYSPVGDGLCNRQTGLSGWRCYSWRRALLAVVPVLPNRSGRSEQIRSPASGRWNTSFLEDWRIVHTPGHTPGHVSLFRKQDRTLIAGDAFITVQQESSMAVFIQHQHVHGPPAYFTHNWDDAEKSVKALAALNPGVAITGHGLPMEGELLTTQLEELAKNFKELAVPKHKRNIH